MNRLKNKLSTITFDSIIILLFIFSLLFGCKKFEPERKIELTTGTIKDSRDGNTYQIARIGNQLWMTENLAWLPSVSPSSTESNTDPYYYVYGYQGTSIIEAKATDNYDTYGVLYNWPAALEACPDGWHLPSDAEWSQLMDFLGGSSVAGGKLKEIGTTHWTSPNISATNESGFTALPGGAKVDINYAFSNIGGYGFWWSSTELSAYSIWYRRLHYDASNVYRSSILPEFGFSVRCVRDD